MRGITTPFQPPLQWLELDGDCGQLTQWLEDHHLAVVAESSTRRRTLCRQLEQELALMQGAKVVAIDGSRTFNLQGWLGALRPTGVNASVADGKLRNLLAALRSTGAGHQWLHVIWNDAHVMLERDPATFSRVVNAFYLIAAELEHISPEPLVLQRLICIGDQTLGRFATHGASPFQRWLEDDGEVPCWEAASVIHHPPVAVCHIDD